MVSILFLLTSSFALFSIILYFLTSATILRFRYEFNSSYYSLYILSSLVNTLTYLNSFLVIRLPFAIDRNNTFSVFYKSSNEDEFIFHSTIFDILAFLTAYFGYVQYGLSAVMSFNRFLVIILPFSHKKLWNRTLLPLMALVFLPPFAFFFRSPFFRTVYMYDMFMGRFWPVSEFSSSQWSILMVGVLVLIALINTILNTVIMAQIARHRKTSHGLNKSHEVKLFGHNFITFIAQVFAIVITILITCSSDLMIRYYGSELLPYASDLLTLLSPYGLLICDGRLRKFFIFRRKPDPPLFITTTRF